jgi:hypothetical protein
MSSDENSCCAAYSPLGVCLLCVSPRRHIIQAFCLAREVLLQLNGMSERDSNSRYRQPAILLLF